jgi:L-lactate dehydrogenase complex protein LldG
MGYIAFITGPSRTADIERVLTIGVHGPQRLIIVAVDELGGNL